MQKTGLKLAAIVMLLALASAPTISRASNIYGVYITEFSSNTGSSEFGGKGEFVEITNTSNVPVDMTGWSEDDSTRTPNKDQHSLSGFGILAPHESAIFTEISPDNFRTLWWGSVEAAPAGLKIIGPYQNDNLSSSGDEINLYDPAGTLMDRLTYNGASSSNPNSGGNGISTTRNGPLSFLNANSNPDWVDSVLGDSFGSFEAALIPGAFGNPGTYPAPFVLVGDVNFDGVVDIQDLTLMANHWLNTDPTKQGPGDANHDGVVDIQDITLAANHWLQTAPQGGQGASVVPEPSTGLLAFAALVAVGFSNVRRRGAK